MGSFWSLSVACLAVAASVHAAVSSTGFTVSLQDVDYFLPPTPVASITGCSEIEASFAHGLFVPFTVLKTSGLDAAYSEDDVWQEAFLDGAYYIAIHMLL